MAKRGENGKEPPMRGHNTRHKTKRSMHKPETEHLEFFPNTS